MDYTKLKEAKAQYSEKYDWYVNYYGENADHMFVRWYLAGTPQGEKVLSKFVKEMYGVK